MIILVYGLPGTGKTLFSKRFSEEIDAYYLNTDEVQGKKDSGTSYEERFKQLAHNKVIKEAEEKLANGKIVIVDGAFHKKALRKKLFKIAKEKGHRLVLIEMQTSPETIKKRMKEHSEYSEEDYVTYKKIRSEFEVSIKDHLKLNSDLETMDTMLIKARDFIFINDD